MSLRLTKDGVEEKEHDHESSRTDDQSDDSCTEPQARHAGHPVAWSTMSAENGTPPLGVTVNESPQWPTITSAGAACE